MECNNALPWQFKTWIYKTICQNFLNIPPHQCKNIFFKLTTTYNTKTNHLPTHKQNKVVWNSTFSFQNIVQCNFYSRINYQHFCNWKIKWHLNMSQENGSQSGEWEKINARWGIFRKRCNDTLFYSGSINHPTVSHVFWPQNWHIASTRGRYGTSCNQLRNLMLRRWWQPQYTYPIDHH